MPDVRMNSNVGKTVLREIIRGLMVSLVLFVGCRPSGVSQGLELQAQDYRAARKQFQTHLLVHSAAPQAGQPLNPPPGAAQVEYAPELHLQAWITPVVGNGPTGGKKPAVLFLHGGFAIGADDWDMAQPYRDAGFVVMLPVLRGENGQNGDYSMFYDEVTDVLAAADYLAKLPAVDAKHIYVAGHSVGGTLTMLAAMASSRFAAAASFSGAADVTGWSSGQQQIIPFDTSNVREYQMRSAVAFAGSFKCPIRLFCGSAEPFFANSDQHTAERAKSKGLDVEAVQVPGDHFSAVPEEIQQSIRFFQAH